MQHIGLRLENERGEIIEKSEINFGDIINSLDANRKESYPWLWGIDPYGMTIFNLHQVPHVIDELNKLGLEIDKKLNLDIAKSIEFLRKIEQHTYIRLIGD